MPLSFGNIYTNWNTAVFNYWWVVLPFIGLLSTNCSDWESGVSPLLSKLEDLSLKSDKEMDIWFWYEDDFRIIEDEY